VWLALVILPAGAAALLALNVIEQRLGEHIGADLANTLRLEAARIESELEGYLLDGDRIASDPRVRNAVAGMRVPGPPDAWSAFPFGGHDGLGAIDPGSVLPLQRLGDALQATSRSAGAEVAELRIVSSGGRVLAQTSGFGWHDPYDRALLVRVLSTGESAFGNAFRTVRGEDRLGLVTPVTRESGEDGEAGEVIGALVLEMRLGPVVDLVVEHEGFGASSEAHIAQPTATGDAEFITLLRFRRDAAFALVVPRSRGMSINTALVTPEGAVIRAADYRGVESMLAMRTLRRTGWGLVVKIDAEEAFAPVVEIGTILTIAFGITIALALAGWLLYLDPLARRLKRASRAAARVAAGDYTLRLADPGGDEIAEMAGSIDRLAADLTADIVLRDAAERRLHHQAAHDDLTGLYNRKHVTERIGALEQAASGPRTGILFMDLDRFKSVNDEFGHASGDAVLAEVGRRLRQVVGERGTVARWGGDEFVVVLPQHDLRDADTIAERIASAFIETFPSRDGRHDVGCSIGVASSAEGGTLAQALTRADARMYEAKAAHHDERRGRVTDIAGAERIDLLGSQDRPASSTGKARPAGHQTIPPPDPVDAGRSDATRPR